MYIQPVVVSTLSVQAQSISDISVSKPGYGVVNTSDGLGANVRRTPELIPSNLIVSAPYGSRLMIVGESGDFYKVQYNVDGLYGYVYKECLLLVPENYYLQANTVSSNLNFRASRDTSAEIIKGLPKGTCFAYWGTFTDWYCGVYGNETGYTVAEYTKLCSY